MRLQVKLLETIGWVDFQNMEIKIKKQNTLDDLSRVVDKIVATAYILFVSTRDSTMYGSKLLTTISTTTACFNAMK